MQTPVPIATVYWTHVNCYHTLHSQTTSQGLMKSC